MSTQRAKVSHSQKFWVEDLTQFCRDNQISLTDEERRSLNAGDRVAVVNCHGGLFELELVR